MRICWSSAQGRSKPFITTTVHKIARITRVFVLIMMKLTFQIINVTLHREPRVMHRRVLVRSAAQGSSFNRNAITRIIISSTYKVRVSVYQTIIVFQVQSGQKGPRFMTDVCCNCSAYGINSSIYKQPSLITYNCYRNCCL